MVVMRLIGRIGIALAIFAAVAGVSGVPSSAAPGLDGGTTVVGPSKSVTVPMTAEPPMQDATMIAARLAQAERRAAGPLFVTPTDPHADVHGGPWTGQEVDMPAVRASGAEPAPAPGDLKEFRETDLGSGNGSLINEPSVASNGSTMLVTWNWFAAVSTDGGATFSFINPSTAFPFADGGFCCDQVAYYIPSRDLFVWVLQYSPDSNDNNRLRLAYAHGAAGVAAGAWSYWDFTPQSHGGANGTNFDQPKLAFTADKFFISVTRYGATGGSIVIRMDLDDLGAGGSSIATEWTAPGLFSPGLAVSATPGSTMYYAAHVDTDTLRVFTWPDSVGFGGITTHNINHTAYAANYPMQCPRTGGSSTSDWCQRRSFGGGWAHTDRIFTGWLVGNELGFGWDSTQGNSGFGQRDYPWVFMVFINPSNYTLTSQRTFSNTNYAFSYLSVHPNSQGDLGATFMYGGGTLYQTCGGAVRDSFTPNWDYIGFVASNADPDDKLSGDYLSTRMNGGTTQTWSATCYAQRGGGANADTHTYYISFGREAYTPIRRLTIDFQGSGTGFVNGLPGNQSCSFDCTVEVLNGVTTDFTASPGSGSSFAGWSGFCSGTSACQIPITADTTIVATFTDAEAPTEPVFSKPGRAVQVRRTFGVEWSSTDNSGTVTKYDIHVRTGKYGGDFGPYQPYMLGTASTSGMFTGQQGYTYCFQGRAYDPDNNVSGWGLRRCTAIPLDDRRLAIDAGSWTRAAGNGYYLKTVSRAQDEGAALRVKDLKVRRIVLVATTCPGCGSVDVYLNQRKIGSVDLQSATMKKRVLIKVAEWFAIHKGTLRIVVTSDGKPVEIDGVGLSKRRDLQ